MNQPLPKWVQVVLVAVIALLAFIMFSSRDRLHVYGIYFREKSPEINTSFETLSLEVDEAAVRQHFTGVPLECLAEGGSSLGDRVCYSAIDKADGNAALTLAIFFRKGRLAHAIVQVPWWSHGKWLRQMNVRYGQSKFAGIVGAGGGPVLRWGVSSGYLEMNRDRAYNPLTWSVVIWTGAKQPA